MSAPDATVMSGPVAGEAVEVHISVDMVKRGLWVAPVLVVLAGMIWDIEGSLSAAFATGLVLVNFLLAAGLIAGASRISLGLVMAATLFGYLIRLGLIMLAVLLVRDASWISLPALGATIIVTHLGLLVWELKYLAITLAHPGLKPARPSSTRTNDFD